MRKWKFFQLFEKFFRIWHLVEYLHLIWLRLKLRHRLMLKGRIHCWYFLFTQCSSFLHQWFQIFFIQFDRLTWEASVSILRIIGLRWIWGLVHFASWCTPHLILPGSHSAARSLKYETSWSFRAMMRVLRFLFSTGKVSFGFSWISIWECFNCH